MDSDTKKLIRAVVRRVHPDLFTASPFERQRNSDSLKVHSLPGDPEQGLEFLSAVHLMLHALSAVT